MTNMKLPFAIFLAVASCASPGLRAQIPVFSSVRPQLQSPLDNVGASGSPDANVAPDPTMIQNRYRTLGNNLSGGGDRYFAASDRDVQGLSPQQALRRLSPPAVSAAQGVRTLDIAINLTEPLTVEAQPGQLVEIGTAVVHAAGLRQVEVNTSIFTNGIRVLNSQGFDEPVAPTH
jgi:hypothetical protein